ncbi:MAG TPA: aminotransferase class III-fold pyridoxal phosphate-dependent enzyme [Candidatus Paceibacterota bacterium]
MNDKKNKGKSQNLWKEAKKIIPGGNQLLSKRAEMFAPDQWPAYFKKARGIKVTDLDGRTYLDFSRMGIGSCVLGYADPDVNRAVKKAIDSGSMSTLNSPEEVSLAKILIRLHPWAQMVRYARTGGEAMSIAVRIARAASGKDTVAFCGYHGWHDWYLSGNLASDKNLDGHLLPGLLPKGVPRGLIHTAIPFRYNHIEELEAIVARHDVGVIVIEPYRHEEPKEGFLQKVKEIARKVGATLVFDEVSAAFRRNAGGVHLLYGVNPDIAVLAKAMSNGYPMAAIIGTKKVMEAAQGTFISSTYWTERVGPVAALATIHKFIKKKVHLHLAKIGKEIEAGWIALASKHGIAITTEGPYAMVGLSFNDSNKQELKTLFVQEMLKRGFLTELSIYVTYAHTSSDVKKYLKAVDGVFNIIARAIKEGTVGSLLEGPVAHSGFARLN